MGLKMISMEFHGKMYKLTFNVFAKKLNQKPEFKKLHTKKHTDDLLLSNTRNTDNPNKQTKKC